MDEKWVRDTGLVFALLFLILGFRGPRWALVVCALFLVALLFWPVAIRPVARAWLFVTELLGSVMNKVFFGLVFFVVVVPMGYIKRITRGDMRDRAKNTVRASAFVERNERFAKLLFTKPY